MHLSGTLKSLIHQSFRKRFPSVGVIQFLSIGGGSINETYCLTDGTYKAFCKINSAQKFPQLFQKEAKGLLELQQANCILVPEVFDVVEENEQQVLLMEWIETGERDTSFWEDFGASLAQLHAQQASQFGFAEDNYMGAVPQHNSYQDDWNHFFQTQRLEPLVNLCLHQHLLNAGHAKKFELLYSQLQQIFGDKARPCLLHGDLWSGNFLCNEQGEPVLIDPAVYYGHPSVDLGMTTLFGGFHQRFYDAYAHHTSFPSNYREQWEVANLYPLLIHLFLFGRSYLPQIEHTLSKFQ